MTYFIVAIGGAIGAALRHGVNRLALAQWGPAFPFGTLIANVLGGLLMGMIAEALVLRGGTGEGWRLFLTTGLLGGFTTFSAFSLEAALMWQRSEYAALFFYVAASILLSIGALFVGMAAVRAVA